MGWVADMSNKAWIGVDLDGTLAKYTSWKGIEHIGEPIEPVLKVVKELLDNGVKVKIFTARVSSDPLNPPPEVVAPIHAWCKQYGLPPLEVTCVKDFAMVKLLDDRCISVTPNQGTVASDCFGFVTLKDILQ